MKLCENQEKDAAHISLAAYVLSIKAQKWCAVFHKHLGILAVEWSSMYSRLKKIHWECTSDPTQGSPDN